MRGRRRERAPQLVELPPVGHQVVRVLRVDRVPLALGLVLGGAVGEGGRDEEVGEAVEDNDEPTLDDRAPKGSSAGAAFGSDTNAAARISDGWCQAPRAQPGD